MRGGVGESLEAGDVHLEDLQLVLGHVEAGELPQGVDLLGRVEQLVAVQPQLCNRKNHVKSLKTKAELIIRSYL